MRRGVGDRAGIVRERCNEGLRHAGASRVPGPGPISGIVPTTGPAGYCCPQGGCEDLRRSWHSDF
eukprot:2612326-Alexandrium_andersonii.AAC.1